MPSGSKVKQQGFTLLELLIVLMLISLVVGIVAPRLGGSLGGVQVKAAVNKLSAMLRYARNVAVTSQKTRVVSFDIELNRVILEGIEESVPADEREISEMSHKVYGRKLYQLPEGVKIEKVSGNHGSGTSGEEFFKLYFYPSGNSSGGEVVLSGKRNNLYRIKIDFLTGLVDASD